ncbi:hypothetical protein BG31_03850 [Bacillus subtilis subsp. subtilis]|uniref:hypothetical protein n=1 Tax=Bacillus subtilis TaxID=1423 RepID=UPI000A3365C7|nr:hypothetical protein [Bacillus subtilis]OTQ89310.1 hypothetical protein BG31_03850 [Bacillus subtilis subsp. subtilis]
MYKAGETVQYWGVKADGLTWLSAEAMIGKVIDWQREKQSYKIEGQSGTIQDVPERLIERGCEGNSGLLPA